MEASGLGIELIAILLGELAIIIVAVFAFVAQNARHKQITEGLIDDVREVKKDIEKIESNLDVLSERISKQAEVLAEVRGSLRGINGHRSQSAIHSKSGTY